MIIHFAIEISIVIRVIFINDELDGDELMLTTAHELGHAFGLTHVDPGMRRSVMNPNNITVSPTSDDVAKLHALWGTCDAAEPSSAKTGVGNDD